MSKINIKSTINQSKFIKRLFRVINYIGFKIKHPMVPLIRPSAVGTYYSQDGQDLYLSALLFDHIKVGREALIVDVGCNHPFKYSNSYFFERHMGCRTIAIDPIAEYGELWKELRPTATFVASALGKMKGTVTLNVPEVNAEYDDMFSTITDGNPKVQGVGWVKRTVPCATLSSVLEASGVNDILLLSIDVEGAELEVLEGIDFERFSIKCLIIENNTGNMYGTDSIRKMLQARGYVFVSRIGFLDDVFLHASLVTPLD